MAMTRLYRLLPRHPHAPHSRASLVARLMCRKHAFPADFIWPIFVIDGVKKTEPVASMPGVERLSIDLAVKAAEEAARWAFR